MENEKWKMEKEGVIVLRQSWTVGRDSVEPKLDLLGKSHGSTESRPTVTHLTDALRRFLI